MKIFEIEQATAPTATAPGATAPQGSNATPAPTATAPQGQGAAPTQDPMPAGQAPTDPAKAEAERKKTIVQQRTALQCQIKSLDDQKKALQQQLATLK